MRLKAMIAGPGLALAACVTGAAAQPAPSQDGIVACVKIGDDGAVTSAFILVSTGDAQRDRMLLSGVQNLRWGKKAACETRNIWFPMGLAINGAQPPDGPAACAPPKAEHPLS